MTFKHKVMKLPGMTEHYYQLLMYLITGGFTTLVSIASFWLLSLVMDYKIANVLSWIISVLYAYVTNKRYVFTHSVATKRELAREAFSFVGYRFITFLIDFALLIILVQVFQLHPVVSKVLTNLLVLVLNYLFSKFIIFKK